MIVVEATPLYSPGPQARSSEAGGLHLESLYQSLQIEAVTVPTHLQSVEAVCPVP